MRILFFGDSQTYGDGLPDLSSTNNTTNPSNLAWPTVASRSMGAECVNLSTRGSSNLQMHWSMRTYDGYRDTDVVVCQWSFDNRDVILKDPLMQIGPWMRNDDAVHYYMVHDDLDMSRRTMLIVEHTALWLTNHGFRWVFFANRPFTVPSHVDGIITDYSMKYFVDLAADGMHPGMETHMLWGKVTGEHISQILSGDVVRPLDIPLTLA